MKILILGDIMGPPGRKAIKKNLSIIKKENSKGITQSYELNADNTLNEATIIGYKIVSKKVMKEKNGWRTMVVLEYKLS